MMKRILVVAAVVATLAPFAAHAQERMSDTRYVAAQRCLAYADLRQLEGDTTNFTALREAVDVGNRESRVIASARENARSIRARAGGASIEALRTQREEACRNFVERGLVQLDADNAAAS